MVDRRTGHACPLRHLGQARRFPAFMKQLEGRVHDVALFLGSMFGNASSTNPGHYRPFLIHQLLKSLGYRKTLGAVVDRLGHRHRACLSL